MAWRGKLAALILVVAWPGAPRACAEDLRSESLAALHRAAHFFRTEVAVEGGYLWRYSEDLARREGEGKADASTIWVQPPGTPAVGEAFLSAYRATGDRYYLEGAIDAATALVEGQLRSGGWDYRIEFEPKQRMRYAYRRDASPGGINVSTLDDDTTQSALRLLMRVDRALGFGHAKIHEAALYALDALMGAQYPNGAWPQRWETAPDPRKFAVKRASYPAAWSRTYPGADYRSHYTFNDNTIADMIVTMLEASDIYGEQKYKQAAARAGGFILLAQMPEPQPAWAQQYDADMHPGWARKFEPPAVTGGESQGVLRTLLRLYRATGNRKYLEPVSRALRYLRASLLPDGRLARFYELRTNRPLFFTRDYQLTWSDADCPTHYSFKVASDLDRIAEEYERLAAGESAGTTRRKAEPAVLEEGLEGRVRAVISTLDARGRWVEAGVLRYQGPEDRTSRIIDCSTFARNVAILCRYLETSRR